METIFDDLHNKVKAIRDTMDEMLVKAMVTHKEEIIDLNVSQLELGMDSSGESITPEYASPEYAQLKKSMGSKAPLGTPDTKLTGDFHSGFFAEGIVSGYEGASGLFMDSHDEKADKLSRQYSNLFGIAPQNIEEMAEPVIETYQKNLIDELTR
jgi:hypothetical protein